MKYLTTDELYVHHAECRSLMIDASTLQVLSYLKARCTVRMEVYLLEKAYG